MTASDAPAVVFFDLGDTLGTPVLSPPPYHLVGFNVFPFAQSVLGELQRRGLRLGVISNTGDDGGPAVNEVLRAAGLLTYFDPSLLIYGKDVGLTKDSLKSSGGPPSGRASPMPRAAASLSAKMRRSGASRSTPGGESRRTRCLSRRCWPDSSCNTSGSPFPPATWHQAGATLCEHCRWCPCT
jgi:hypothetical protein